jgi:hypothetical protein
MVLDFGDFADRFGYPDHVYDQLGVVWTIAHR